MAVTVIKPKVVTTQKAMEILGCKPSWFHRRYKPMLTRMPSTDNRVYYLYNEVLKIKEERDNKESPYEVVE